MKRFISFFLLSASVMNNLQAEQGQNMLINQDRIWVYENTIPCNGEDENGAYSGRLRTVTKYRFGDVVERYGREYTEWILMESQDIEAVTYAADPETVVMREHPVENIDSVASYMREEDKKVYLLLDDRGYSAYCRENGKNVKYSPAEGEETMLYDFSVGAGDTFTSIYSGCILTGMNVVKTEDVRVGGNDARKIIVIIDAFREKIEASDTSGLEWPLMIEDAKISLTGLAYVEGVGSISYGGMTEWLEYMKKLMYPFGNIPTLSRVCDLHGNEIYIAEPHTVISGIESVDLSTSHQEGKSTSGIIMDLHGRAVTNPVPGSIYIRNGKKYVAE